jgi:indolepyruvate ferredoxin oxidoreductase alpha subunit
VALAAHELGVQLGTGYPGTPSTEILEALSALGGPAQWAPNEKVALEVALGVAFAGGRALCTMKHVGLNVAADALFTLAYTGVSGGLVIVSADDPGMASSQNEQDNRHYAKFAGVPMLEPSDSQEAYDFTRLAMSLSERFGTAVLLRLTTRVCHSKGVVVPAGAVPPLVPEYRRDIPGRVMIPAFARPAHRRLRERLARIAAWNEAEGPNRIVPGVDGGGPALITSGVTYHHVREAAPGATVLKLGMTWPLPLATIRRYAEAHGPCRIVEEGEDFLHEELRTAGLAVTGKDPAWRFGEMTVARVRRLLAGEPDAVPSAVPKGTPPRLCPGCPHRQVFEILAGMDCIVAGDIGCYSLGALPPYEAMETLVCMGAAVGVGLGMRHALPPERARRVISLLGDSTFMHGGIPGIVEMVYNPPPTGHVVLVLDNGTTAMTGLQEHPGTGRRLDRRPARQVLIEEVARGCGVGRVEVVDPVADPAGFASALASVLDSGELAVIVARRECLLAVRQRRKHEAAEAACGGVA